MVNILLWMYAGTSADLIEWSLFPVRKAKDKDEYRFSKCEWQILRGLDEPGKNRILTDRGSRTIHSRSQLTYSLRLGFFRGTSRRCLCGNEARRFGWLHSFLKGEATRTGDGIYVMSGSDFLQSFVKRMTGSERLFLSNLLNQDWDGVNRYIEVSEWLHRCRERLGV